jgi:hypothetical protein
MPLDATRNTHQISSAQPFTQTQRLPQQAQTATEENITTLHNARMSCGTRNSENQHKTSREKIPVLQWSESNII